MFEIVAFLEAKEMARDALTKQSATAAISGYKEKSGYKHTTKPNTKTTCKECSVEIDKFSWSKKQGRMLECILCITCWKKANPRKKMGKDTSNMGNPPMRLVLFSLDVLNHLLHQVMG